MNQSPHIWTPSQPKQTEKVVVLEHHQTHRLLMLLDDEFASFVAKHGYIKHEVNTAAEYDAFAKRIIAQDKAVTDEQEFREREKQDAIRKRLRSELNERMSVAQPGEREYIAASLKALDLLQRRKERVRGESHFLKQGYDDSRKDAGEELAKRIITNNNG